MPDPITDDFMRENQSLVAEGVILGRPFKITAYTWKRHPENGVRFDAYEGDRHVFQNMSASDALGFVAMRLSRALDRME